MSGGAPDEAVADVPVADVPVVDVLVVDAANVVGARADGWWRDRAGAAARLVERLAALPGLPERVVVVLEGVARDADTAALETASLEVVRAPRDGDAAVVDVVRRLRAPGARPGPDVDVLVVTSDRGLRARVEAEGARSRGAGWLRERLDAADGARTPGV